MSASAGTCLPGAVKNWVGDSLPTQVRDAYLEVTAPDNMTAGRNYTLSESAGAMTLYLEVFDSVTNQILDDLVKACRPRSMKLIADFYIRGGIHTIITVTHQAGDRK